MKTTIMLTMIVATTLAGLALLSMPVPQQASAQCVDHGSEGQGATTCKFDFGTTKCHTTITPSDRFSSHCNGGF